MKRHIWIPATLLLLWTCGCGGGSSSSGDSGGGPPPPEPAPTLESIDIQPNDPSINVGESIGFTVTGTFSDGSTGSAAVNWESSDDTIAIIAPNGTAQGIASGIVTITARADSDPAILDTTTLSVVAPILYAGSSTEGLVEFSWDGSFRAVIAWDPEPGQGLPASIYGSEAVPGGVYVLTAAQAELWFWDENTNIVKKIHTYASSYTHNCMCVDSQGRVYVIDLGNADILRYDPATQQVTTFGQAMGLPVDMKIDANDNIYVQDFMPSSIWVHKYDTNGNPTQYIYNPAGSLGALGYGMAFADNGVIYLGDCGGSVVYRCEDLDQDGVYMSTGEVVPCTDPFENLWGIYWKDNVLLVNDTSADKIFQLKDVNLNGSFEPDEITEWNGQSIYSGGTADIFHKKQ